MKAAFNRVLSAAAALFALLATPATAQTTLPKGCESDQIMALAAPFFATGRMTPELARFLGDDDLQRLDPYRAFDNVAYVGVCWVSAWLLTSPRGHVLIDSLYGSYTDRLLDNVRRLGYDPKDIKLVVMTHGHRDHAGGAARLKQVLDPGTRFAMSAEGWREAAATAAQSTGTPNAWTMIEQDVVLTDGQTISGGDVTIQSFETPGHTMGTLSFAFDARDGAQTWRAVTVGGLALNAIRGPEQVEAFIASVKRLRAMTEDGTRPLQLHLSTHGFSNGLNEAKQRLQSRKPGDPHPMVDLPGLRKQLDQLQDNAEKRLVVERQKKAG